MQRSTAVVIPQLPHSIRSIGSWKTYKGCTPHLSNSTLAPKGLRFARNNSSEASQWSVSRFQEDAVNEDLDRLQKEILFFGRLVSTVAEVVDGPSGDPVKVCSLQSSDFAIELATNISIAAGVANAVQYLVRGLKKLNEIRAVKDDMQKLGFEQNLLDEVDQKGEAAIDAEIEEVNASIFQDHKIDDEGRVNELRTGISLRLKGLAARLERGYSVEVRTNLPAEPTEDEEQKGAAITVLSQVRFERTTPLLKLTDGEEEPASPKKTPVKRPGRKRASTPTE